MANDLQNEIKNLNQTPEVPEESSKSIQTYQSDMAKAVKEKEGSVVKIALAEQERNARLGISGAPKSAKNITLLAIGIALLVIGIGAISYGIVQLKQKSPAPVSGQSSTTSLIQSNTQKEIDTTSLTREQIFSKLQEEERTIVPVQSTIRQLKFVETNESTSEVLSANKFLEKIGSTVPPALLRSLDPNMMFGVFTGTGNQPFLMLKTDSYGIAFADMLTWETTMPNDILPLFYSVTGENTLDSSSNLKWTDKVIKNQDTRSLIGADGKVILFYTFLGPDKNMIVIATQDTTLTEIVRRLQ